MSLIRAGAITIAPPMRLAAHSVSTTNVFRASRVWTRRPADGRRPAKLHQPRTNPEERTGRWLGNRWVRD